MAKTFDVEVEGIGAFTFRRRTMRDQFKIEGETSRLLGGPVNDPTLVAGAGAFAELAVLTVEAPADWDLEGLDPFAPVDSINTLWRVHGALRKEEERFRGNASGNGKRPGAGDESDNRVPVPAKIQDAAD